LPSAPRDQRLHEASCRGPLWPGVTRRVSPAGHLGVSMAGTHLENQLQSAQKNLLFLQREHASTLRGLHAEVRRLQQHCTDLTYELTLKSSEQTGDGASRSSELKKRCEELEAQLKSQEKENTELLKELEQKNAMILVLENTIREREKKYLEELKVKSHKLNMLASELEQRAGTIAYLTAQLHAAKKRLLSSSGTSEASPSGSPSAQRGREPQTALARARGCDARPHPVPAGPGVCRGPPRQGAAPCHSPHRFRPRRRRQRAAQPGARQEGTRGGGAPHPPPGPRAARLPQQPCSPD
uniref:Coiled-coil domain containing 92 n=1 Tax=Loxodonta africana TaxID=9785 RepID=G3TRB3_LOXAF